VNIHLALITGATSGLGKELCRLAAKKGIALIITGRSQEKLEELAAELTSAPSVTCRAANLSKRAERNMLIHLIHSLKPDLIINNAGFGLYGEALSHALESQADILEVNGNALMELTLEGARALILAGKKGVILNVSSAAAYFAYPDLAVYAASKAFALQFSKALDCEVAPLGVRVLVACPGQIATSFRERASAGHPQKKDFFTLSAKRAARLIFKQIKQQKRVTTFGLCTKLGLLLSSLLPSTFIQKKLRAALSGRFIKKPTSLH
jgi:short-subunit dehydrogenase